ncbi:unnamed protein product [Polarella glacialis]|uniref:Uncharacterized protein n=1 Tax=Polarella glacialis TaxID=89957 RepID=A0A813LP12_POLGL|nr:unnamed protein product [Polarella glacialis]
MAPQLASVSTFVASVILSFQRCQGYSFLEANAFTPYPLYNGMSRASGSVNFKAGGWDDDDNDEGSSNTQIMSYSLSGLDPTCGNAAVPGVENSCGVHLHEG